MFGEGLNFLRFLLLKVPGTEIGAIVDFETVPGRSSFLATLNPNYVAEIHFE